MSKVEEDWQEMTCPVCGRSFYVNSYRQQRRYCSVTCRNKAQWQRVRERKERLKKPKRCEVCGKEFMPTRRDNRYCSRYCTDAASRARNERNREAVIERANRFGDKCDEAARVAVSALPRHVADGLRWIMSTNCGEYKVLQAWLEGEDSDGQELKRIRERMR